jgi:hypothetical protein
MLTALSAPTALADRFCFGITNITTHSTLQWTDDNLILAIGSIIGDQASNSSLPLVSNHTAGTSIVLNNLAHEMNVPFVGLNMSVAFAVVNVGMKHRKRELSWVRSDSDVPNKILLPFI